MISYPNQTFDDVTDVLEERANAMGCHAFRLGDEAMSHDVTMDAAGPLGWALIIHANAIAQLAGISRPYELNALPFRVSPNDNAPFRNEVVLQPSRLPISVALNFLDASLEHAISIGMRELGYKPSEWEDLPDENKVIPIEPYLNDLRNNWVTDQLETGNTREQIENWPALLDLAQLEIMDSNLGATQDQGINRSRILKMSSPSQ